MGILSVYTDTAGQINVNPRRVKIITTDALATVTTAGYLNNVSLQGYTIEPTDVIDMWYGATGNPQVITNPGTYEVFTPSISNGIITLVAWANPGNVLLPVVSGHLAAFNGTSGQIKDSGLAPSSTTSQLFAVTTPGSLTAGNFPILNDANGTLNAGRTPSATTAGYKVVMSPGSIVAGNLLKAADANGTVADAGGAILAKTTAVYGGGGTSNAFVATGLTASSIVTAVILTSTNAASIVKAIPSANTLTIDFSVDPGANTTVNYIAITPAI